MHNIGEYHIMFIENIIFLRPANKNEKEPDNGTLSEPAENTTTSTKEKKQNEATPKILQCDTCGETSPNLLKFLKHLKTHNEKSFKCEICHKTFSKKRNLNEHMNVHSDRVKCSICKLWIPNQAALVAHLRTHSDSVKCNECERVFPKQDELHVHRKNEHGIKQASACPVCGKPFTVYTSLQRHMLSHSDSKRFKCNVCGRDYSRPSILAAHLRQVHRKERPFVCSMCGVAFAQKGQMQMHVLRIHINKRPEKVKQYIRKMIPKFVHPVSESPTATAIKRNSCMTVTSLETYKNKLTTVSQQPSSDLNSPDDLSDLGLLYDLSDIDWEGLLAGTDLEDFAWPEFESLGNEFESLGSEFESLGSEFESLGSEYEPLGSELGAPSSSTVSYALETNLSTNRVSSESGCFKEGSGQNEPLLDPSDLALLAKFIDQ